MCLRPNYLFETQNPLNDIRSYRRFTDRFWTRTREIRESDHEVLREIRIRAGQLANETQEHLSEAASVLREEIQTSAITLLARSTVIESFALTAEALRRATGKVYYDCQLLAGLVLATGAIAEMQTGEGKTITCGLPAILYGMTGKGVHVATTNAYLAERDHEEMLPVFQQLGISSALVASDQGLAEKQVVYSQDITYGTGYDFGFDFLRDQLTMRNKTELPLGTRFLGRLRGMKNNEPSLMQRPLAFAIIDEADSVLIDEATTPLILSGAGGSTKPSQEVYQRAMWQSNQLQEKVDYEVDDVKKSIRITDQGWNTLHQELPATIQSSLQRPWSQYVEQALRASLMLHRDIDYVVERDQIILVDQNTGRIHDERKWRSGLHQAIETKEGVPLTEEREIEARITRQRYFGFYESVAGMTGTAQGNEAELLEFYRLPVVNIPRNKPSGRRTLPARYFSNKDAKYAAIVDDVVARVDGGQPVLVGTRSITQSRELSELLSSRNQQHTLLNGTQDENEADIVATAGQAGQIMIATNMAGRGTDIRLDEDAQQAGGLHVVVVEHHDSPRVDRQLIGRSARQSDPGSCQFFVAADDEIITRYDAQLAKKIVASAGNNGESSVGFDQEVAALQKRIEQINYVARRKLVVHDRWIESVQESVAKLA